MRDFFLLSLLTGARRANVLAMRWAEIDLDEAVWRIPETKNGTPQNVPLLPEALEILRTRKVERDRNMTERSAFVFPGQGTRGHLAEPKYGWQRIFDRDELRELAKRIKEAGGEYSPKTDAAGHASENLQAQLNRARAMAAKLKIDTTGARIPDLRIHDLRRTLGSWQAKTGASLAIIGKSLNHKSIQSTAIYARLDLDPVRESVERATSAMLTAAGLKKPARQAHQPDRDTE